MYPKTPTPMLVRMGTLVRSPESGTGGTGEVASKRIVPSEGLLSTLTKRKLRTLGWQLPEDTNIHGRTPREPTARLPRVLGVLG